jgi:hypothetical protein
MLFALLYFIVRRILGPGGRPRDHFSLCPCAQLNIVLAHAGAKGP